MKSFVKTKCSFIHIEFHTIHSFKVHNAMISSSSQVYHQEINQNKMNREMVEARGWSEGVEGRGRELDKKFI